jgi:hypothetical protein
MKYEYGEKNLKADDRKWATERNIGKAIVANKYSGRDIPAEVICQIV